MDVSEPICPRCKQNPRQRASSGRINPYCSPCATEKGREISGHEAAERVCDGCGSIYRGNSRALAQLCQECRTHCVTCGEKKSAGDKKHLQCPKCRANGKTCAACKSHPTVANRTKCWRCLTADGTYAAQVRDRIYNLPSGWFSQRMTEQEGRCIICGNTEHAINKKTGSTYPLAVDHDRSCCQGDRSCGKCLRGLICRNCNVMLGMARNDPALLRAAADYLDQF